MSERTSYADTPAGRLAILADPWGAAFAVIALSQQALEGAPE